MVGKQNKTHHGLPLESVAKHVGVNRIQISGLVKLLPEKVQCLVSERGKVQGQMRRLPPHDGPLWNIHPGEDPPPRLLPSFTITHEKPHNGHVDDGLVIVHELAIQRLGVEGAVEFLHDLVGGLVGFLHRSVEMEEGGEAGVRGGYF